MLVYHLIRKKKTGVNSLRATLFFVIYHIFFLLAYVLCITFTDDVSVIHSNILNNYMRYISYKVFGGVREGRNLNDFSIVFFSFFFVVFMDVMDSLGCIGFEGGCCCSRMIFFLFSSFLMKKPWSDGAMVVARRHGRPPQHYMLLYYLF